MATRTFTGRGAFNNPLLWDGAVSTPSAGDDLVVNGLCTLSAHEAPVYGAVTIGKASSVAGVAWTRAGTVVTVVSALHGMLSGDPINVTVTSDSGAVAVKPYHITFVDVNTFTIVGANAGAASGTLTYNPAWMLALATFDFACGAMTVNGELDILVSSASGLACAGMTFALNSGLDLAQLSKIVNSGAFSAPNAIYFYNNRRGDYTQAGSGSLNMANANSNNVFWNYTCNSGVVLNLTASFKVADATSNNFTMNGSITAGGNSFQCGAGIAGTFTWAASADITGTSSMTMIISVGAVIAYNRTTALSVSTVVFGSNSGATRQIISADFSLSNVAVTGPPAGAATLVPTAGTLKCKNFTITQNVNQNITFANNTNNPSFEISGLVNFKDGTGVYTLLWTRGSGVITLGGSSGTQAIDFQGQAVEALVIAATGAVKNIVVNFSALSLSGSGGTLQSSVGGTQRVVTATNKGTCTGMAFKDISMASAKKVGAKASCTNLGNNLGIVFRDRMRVN